MAKGVIDVDGKQYDAEVHETLDHRFVVDVMSIPGMELHVNGNTRAEAIANAVITVRNALTRNLLDLSDKKLTGSRVENIVREKIRK